MSTEAERRAKASWKKRNPERARMHSRNTMRRLKAANPEKYRAMGRKSRGLPLPTRPAPQLCECCGKPERPERGICLDHDHPSGKFRGWLCHKCNTAIGALGDNWQGVYAALDYLFRNGFGPA
jgi:hypothetical protein